MIPIVLSITSLIAGPYPDFFGGGANLVWGPPRPPIGSRAKPGEECRQAKPPGSRREIRIMRVKIQSPRLHFPVSFHWNFFSKFTKIIHKSCSLKRHD
jgi:hypothetical protein